MIIKNILLRVFITFIFLKSLISVIYAQQNDFTKISSNNAYVFCLIPSVKDNIYGIAFGIIGSETICNRYNLKKTHGINFQIIGQGLFIPMNPRAFNYKALYATDSSWMASKRNKNTFRTIHNGILISGFGTMTDQTNGLVLSGLSSLGYKLNGIAINLLGGKYTFVNGISIAINNESFKVNGLQIGFLNRTTSLKGFQIGLWNINEKRNLPLVNWAFK